MYDSWLGRQTFVQIDQVSKHRGDLKSKNKQARYTESYPCHSSLHSYRNLIRFSEESHPRGLNANNFFFRGRMRRYIFVADALENLRRR